MELSKIKELVRSNENDVLQYEEEITQLRSRIKFCRECRFDEEVRIALLKLNAMETIVYNYRQFIKGLEKILEIE